MALLIRGEAIFVAETACELHDTSTPKHTYIANHSLLGLFNQMLSVRLSSLLP